MFRWRFFKVYVYNNVYLIIENNRKFVYYVIEVDEAVFRIYCRNLQVIFNKYSVVLSFESSGRRQVGLFVFLVNDCFIFIQEVEFKVVKFGFDQI